MKHLLALLATITILAAPAAAQTIKTLGYATNGQVVVGTNNLTFTNTLTFPLESCECNDRVAPSELLDQLDAFYGVESNIQCYNYGVFGGSNVGVLKSVYGKIVEICHQMESQLVSTPKITFLSCAIEQIIAPALIQINGCRVDCIYGNTPMGFGHAAIAGEKYGCRHMIGRSKLETKYSQLILGKFEHLSP